MKPALIILLFIAGIALLIGLAQLMPERHGACDTRGSIASTLNCGKGKP